MEKVSPYGKPEVRTWRIVALRRQKYQGADRRYAFIAAVGRHSAGGRKNMQ